MKKYALLASAASLFAACSAIAADLPARKVAPVAPVAPAFTWTGFYAGINAGVNWSNRNVNTNLSDPEFPNLVFLNEIQPPVVSNSRTGFIGGIQVGYNYQINQFVIGAEADFMGAALSKRSTSATSVTTELLPEYSFTEGSVATTKVEQNWLGTVRARAGFAVDRFLVYATGGLAYGNVKSQTNVALPFSNSGALSETFPINAQDNYSGSKTQTKAGYVVGAGVEYALTDNWIIRGEYMYYNLGGMTNIASATTSTFNGVTEPNVSTIIGRTKTTIDGNIVRAALSYKF